MCNRENIVETNIELITNGTKDLLGNSNFQDAIINNIFRTMTLDSENGIKSEIIILTSSLSITDSYFFNIVKFEYPVLKSGINHMCMNLVTSNKNTLIERVQGNISDLIISRIKNLQQWKLILNKIYKVIFNLYLCVDRIPLVEKATTFIEYHALFLEQLKVNIDLFDEDIDTLNKYFLPQNRRYKYSYLTQLDKRLDKLPECIDENPNIDTNQDDYLTLIKTLSQEELKNMWMMFYLESRRLKFQNILEYLQVLSS